MRLLLQYGADPRIPDATLNTPIHISSSSPDRVELLRILLEESQPGMLNEQSLCKIQTSRGETPLLSAARFGTLNHVSMLIDACRRGEEPDVHIFKPKVRLWDVQDVNGEAPLHAAAMRNEAGIVRLLLDCGANAFLKTETRETALDLARLLNCVDVLKVLTSAGADLKTGRREEERKKLGGRGK